MKTFGLFILLSIITGNPILALGILLLLIFILDRRYIGILPDIMGPWRRASRVGQLRREVQLNPANADAYLELGETYFRQGKYELAASFLKNASGKMSGHPLFHFYLGASGYHLGKRQEAKKEIEKAVASNPKASFGEPYYYLIRINLEENRPVEVEKAFEQLMLYGSPRVYYQAAKVFLNAGNKDKARSLFKETIDNYEACGGAFRRLHRRWAVLSRLSLLTMK